MTETTHTDTNHNAVDESTDHAATSEAKRPRRRPNATSRATENGLEIRFELPGARRESIELTLEDGDLQLFAATTLADPEGPLQATRLEFRAADFAGRWTLPDDVTADGARTSYENGVLRLELPRRAPSRQTIEIA